MSRHRSATFPPMPKGKPGTNAKIWLWGKHRFLGPIGSPQYYRRYQEWLQKWNDNGGQPPAEDLPDQTVAEVVARFMADASSNRSNPDGSKPWSELSRYAYGCRPLLMLFGSTPAAKFGPKALKAVQKAMATGSWSARWVAAHPNAKPPGPWSRRVVNRHTVRIQTLWRWAESEELVPAGSHAALATVAGLRKHEHGAPERPKVAPAPAANVQACLPHLNPITRAMVELLLLTAARPGELCRWRPCDIIRGGRVEVAEGSWADLGTCWCAVLSDHKTAEKSGEARYTLIGPQAQAVLLPLLDRPADAWLFSAAEGRRLQLAAKRAARKSRVQPSQVDRGKTGAKRRPRDRYTPAALYRAIEYACRRAGVPKFSPYRLRHSAITTLGSLGDAEGARIAAGHSSLQTTKIYLVDSLARAADLVGKAG